MRVLMIAPTPFFSHRGTHIRILEEARALEKRGHAVTIVTYHIGDDIHAYIDTAIDVRRIRRWLFWYQKTEAGADWQKILLNLFLIRKTFYMTRTWNPDVIHGHLHEGILIGWLMKMLFFWRRMTFVADFHGSLVGEMRSHGYLTMAPLAFVFKRLERWINGMGDAAVVSSTDHVTTIAEARHDARAYHIYDGVDTELYDAIGSDQAELRTRYSVPVDAWVAVYTGGLVKNKGVAHILDAARETRAEHDVHYVIGGYPDAWVRDFVATHDLSATVTVISPLNYFSLPEVNALADITIDPKGTTSHQASGKILQYMAAAKPTICADRETNRAYVGDAGIYIEPVSGATIAAALLGSRDDRGATQERGAQARHAVERFSWTKVGEKIEGVYIAASSERGSVL